MSDIDTDIEIDIDIDILTGFIDRVQRTQERDGMDDASGDFVRSTSIHRPELRSPACGG